MVHGIAADFKNEWKQPSNFMNTYRATQKPIFWRLRQRERRIILVTGDLILTMVAMVAALAVWAIRDNYLDFSFEFLRERPPMWFFLLPIIWISLMSELYDVRRASRRSDTVRGIMIAAVVSLALYLVVFFLSPRGSLPRFGVLGFIVSAFVLTMVWRMTYINVFTAPQFMRRVLIVGAGRAGTTLSKIVNELWPPPFFLVGYIDDDQEKQGIQLENHPVLGGCANLMEIVQSQNVTDIVFAISGEMSSDMFQVLMQAEEQGIEVTTMPMIYEELLGRVPIYLLHSDWLLRSFLDDVHTGQLFEMGKRTMDILGGLVGTLLFLVMFPIVGLLILLDNGFPILYKQNRLGKSGQHYKIIKFRTMHNDAEADGKATPATENDNRVTGVGRFLRKTHLDEVPQFFNVLNGDMSLVGPRAERIEMLEEWQRQLPFYRARLLVRPGLTGWAQINQKYASTLEQTAVKLEYDLYYIKHRSLVLDLSILLQTVGTVIGFRGL
jgi:exopolysaccharide biosynthesis polyprenyl glycosylphosphotransferase